MNKRVGVALLLLLVSTAFVLAVTPDQPRMTAAKSDLQRARAELVAADNNKGGHRVKALALVNQAIAAVNRGIAFDRRRNHVYFEIDLISSAAAFDQPHMRRALDHLKDARNNLEQATTDKGGHRVRAIQLIDQAIEQVNLGIAAGR